jgi:hypothetical protein
MRRSMAIFLAAAAVAACDSKPMPTVDVTRGGAKAMERAQDVSKVLEQGAARTREAEDAAAAGDPMKKGY